jgi:hypothetical protein
MTGESLPGVWASNTDMDETINAATIAIRTGNVFEGTTLVTP